MDKAKYHTEFATVGKQLFDEYDARGRAILFYQRIAEIT